MNKKPGLLFVVSLLAIIILAASFHMDFGGNAPVAVPAGVNPDSVLYVCPIAKDGIWGQLASALHGIGRYVYLFFAFMVLVLMFSWGWALYQNLLKDKFSADAYKNPWDLTKVVFWVAVACFVLFKTPDYFRRVEIRGHGSNWVLCENSSEGARVVRPGAVTIPEK